MTKNNIQKMQFGLAMALMLLMPKLWAQTQQSLDVRIQKLMTEGDKRFGRGDFQRASKLYVRVAQLDSTHALAIFKAGISYLYNGMPKKGLSFIEHSREIDPDVNPSYYYWLGRGFHLNFRMDSALIYYRKFVRLNKNKSSVYKTEAQKFIEQAHRGRSFFITVENTPFRLENLGDKINSSYSERSPVFSKDGNTMFFTTRRPLSDDEKVLDDGEFYEKVFYSYKKVDGTWLEAIPLFPELNDNSHLICIQLIENDTKLLLFKPNSLGGGQLLFTEFIDDKWTKPKPYDLGLSASDFAISAYLSADMQHFFYSTFPNRGNLDIFEMSRKKGKSWSSASALPKFINTDDDETSPHLTTDNKTLYFSSKGHQGLGGFDLFRSRWDANTNSWTAPQNAGYPINTPGDELDYSEIQEFGQTVGILSAERVNGFGKTDIFKVLPSNYTEISGYVTDNKGKALPDINVIIRDKYNVIYDNMKTDTGGFYKSRNVLAGQNYDVVIMDKQTFVKTTPLTIPVTSTLSTPIKKDFMVDVSLQALKEANAAVKFNLDTLPEGITASIPKVNVRNDSVSIADDAELLKGPDMPTVASSNQGYNLSGQSTEKTYQMVPRGITLTEEQRKHLTDGVNAAGMAKSGEELAAEAAAIEKAKKAFADSVAQANADAANTIVFEEKRGSNNKVNKIVKKIVIKQPVPDSSVDVVRENAAAAGYKKTSKRMADFDETEMVAPLGLNDKHIIWIKKPDIPMEGRKVLGSFEVFFEKNKFDLSAMYKQHLQEVVKAGKDYKTRIAQIVGYSDPFGQDDLNLKLSALRAKAVLAYLRSIGIKTELVSAAGKGALGDTELDKEETDRQKLRKVRVTLYAE